MLRKLPAAVPPSLAPKRIGMWDDERRRPLLYAALYGTTFAASLLLSHAYAAGWLQ